MKIIDFIKFILNKNNVNDILNECDENDYSGKGFIFEAITDILIKFGFIFSNSIYKHKLGNVNSGNIKNMESIYDYIKNNNVKSGNSSGKSDITLYNEKLKQYTFISCKYFKKEKSVENYDISEIVNMALHKKHIYGENYKICLFVNNKNDVLSIKDKSHKSSVYNSKYITENSVFDIHDLDIAFGEFKKFIENINIENIDTEFNIVKDYLRLHFHQELIICSTIQEIENGEKQFLWGCKCRSGKTYMVGGLISKYYQKYKKQNKPLHVCVITPAPTETSSQFVDDLFNKFSDFKDFTIIHLDSGNKIDELEFNNNENVIIVTSKQLLQRYTKDDKDGDKTIIKIKNLNFDFIIFDENHYGGTTKLSRSILNTYSNPNCKHLYLTATYQKPEKEWAIVDNCKFYWDIEDENWCKKRDLVSLSEKHGTSVNDVMKYFNEKNYSTEDILSYYDKCPSLQLITTIFDQERYDDIREIIQDTKYGFSMETLFSLNKDLTNFNFENEVETFIRYISGSNRMKDFPKGDQSIFTRIKNISHKNNSRTLFDNEHFTTQLWFLPFGQNLPIDKVSECLKSKLLNDGVCKKYEIMIINSKSEYKLSDLKGTIQQKEYEAKADGKCGLILLAGNQCSLGITLPLVDTVFLLNNSMSSDRIMQMMMRSMTEAEGKKYGYVVDMNISRVLNTLIEYQVSNKSLNIEDKIRYMIKNHLINIDDDYFESKNKDGEIIVQKLLSIWKNDPINTLKTLMKKIENSVIELDNSDQKLLNQFFTKSVKGEKTQAEVIVTNDQEQTLPNGKEVISDTSSIDSDKEDKEEKEKKEELIYLHKDVLPFIIPLSCILNIKNKNRDLFEMIEIIGNNEELLEIFNDTTFIWWNKSSCIELVKKLLKKYVLKDSDIYNNSILIKMQLESLIDKPQELLEFINQSLKPKEVEKKKYGEVFTPMKLVNDMLDKLPIEVWNNPSLKWLDPANGMGNFPIAVYYRLMDGLKEKIPNEKNRKKHILENMLYMVELTKKNCYLAKTIFDIKNEYKLNIYEGSYLDFNPKTIFNINKFDIIIGNPPYNKDNVSTGNSIWQLFVKKSISEIINNGYLLFVHPSTWRKPSTDSAKYHELFKLMTFDNQMLYLEIHNTKDGIKVFDCGTRYDWYLIQNKKSYTNTCIKDELNKISYIDLTKWHFLPNYNIEIVEKLLSNNNNNTCNILYNRSNYGADKKWVKDTKTEEFKYQLIHSTPKSGIRYKYSSKNDSGHFGISKLIFGESGIYNAIIDNNGIYGMTHGAMALCEPDIEKLKLMKIAIESNIFKNILASCSWSNFRIDWMLFTYFKKDFYIEILNMESNEQIDNNSVSSTTSSQKSSSSKSSKLSSILINDLCICKTTKGTPCTKKGKPEFDGRCGTHKNKK